MTRSLVWSSALAVGCVLAAVAAFPSAARAQARLGAVPFAGTWLGKWSNSQGESGEETLEVRDGGRGRLSAVWSGPGFRCDLHGERLGPDALCFEGTTEAGVSYRVIGRFQDDELLLHFTAKNRKTGTEWYGIERSRRLVK